MAASRDVLVKSFIDLFRKFSRDLSDAYGSKDNELKALHNSVALFSTTFPEKCQELFHTHLVTPYGDQIDARNENFFMSDEFANHVSKHDVRNVANIDALSLLQRLRGIWKDVVDTDKDNIWKYLVALVRLSRHIAASGDGRV